MRPGGEVEGPDATFSRSGRTFLEDALFPAGRSRTLLEKWRVPLDQLLDYALSHELGHAICCERDEPRVYELATQLNRFGHAACARTLAANPTGAR